MIVKLTMCLTALILLGVAKLLFSTYPLIRRDRQLRRYREQEAVLRQQLGEAIHAKNEEAIERCKRCLAELQTSIRRILREQYLELGSMVFAARIPEQTFLRAQRSFLDTLEQYAELTKLLEAEHEREDRENIKC